MKIHIHLVPWSKSNSIDKIWIDLLGFEVYKVKISAKPIDWQANKALIEYLSQFFDKPKRNINIVSWFTSREKIVEIL